MDIQRQSPPNPVRPATTDDSQGREFTHTLEKARRQRSAKEDTPTSRRLVLVNGESFRLMSIGGHLVRRQVGATSEDPPDPKVEAQPGTTTDEAEQADEGREAEEPDVTSDGNDGDDGGRGVGGRGLAERPEEPEDENTGEPEDAMLRGVLREAVADALRQAGTALGITGRVAAVLGSSAATTLLRLAGRLTFGAMWDNPRIRAALAQTLQRLGGGSGSAAQASERDALVDDVVRQVLSDMQSDLAMLASVSSDMANEFAEAIRAMVARAVTQAIEGAVVLPLARSPAGRAAFEALAAGATSFAGPGQIATPGQGGDGMADGFVPINPDRSSEAVPWPGVETMTTIQGHGSVTLSAAPGSGEAPTSQPVWLGHGSPPPAPRDHWIGAPGSPQGGAPLSVDWSLNPALIGATNAVATIVARPARTLFTLTKAVAEVTTRLGAVTLATGVATGSLRFSTFTAGSEDLPAADRRLDRIVNQPKGSVIMSLGAKIPLTPPEWGMSATLYAGGIRKTSEPYVFPAVLQPGQRGVPPWISAVDGRLRVISQYNIGWNIGVAGFVTGNENLFVNRMLLFNLPRIGTPLLQTDLGPSASRGTVADVNFGGFLAPASLLAVTEYGTGPLRFAQGMLLSPVFSRTTVGTQGLQHAAKLGPLDVIQFGSVAPNPSYNPDDPVLDSVRDMADFLRGVDSGGSEEEGGEP